MKAYTDLEQSKKLSEILSLESADNYYSWHDERYYVVNKDCPYPYSLKEKIPCWSLAVLLGILHDYTLQTNVDGTVFVVCESKKPMISDAYDSPIDACYEMILRLHKLKML